MLEVLFSDSAAGSLKASLGHHAVIGESECCTIGIIATDENDNPLSPEETERLRQNELEKMRRNWAEAVPMESSPKDVLPISLGLSMGPIDEDGLGPLRETTLEQLFCIFPEGKETAAEMLAAARSRLNTLLDRAPREPVRIWTDHTPDAACGLCWLMEQLRPLGWENLDLRVVDLARLPAWDRNPLGGRCTGDIAPHEWGHLARETQPLPACRAEALAAHWGRLRQENAPLRAMLNDMLVSAAEDLYDPYLRWVLDTLDDTFNEANLIGRTLGQFPLGFGDVWLAMRVEQWIADGKLEAVTKPDAHLPLYHRTLRKTEE